MSWPTNSVLETVIFICYYNIIQILFSVIRFSKDTKPSSSVWFLVIAINDGYTAVAKPGVNSSFQPLRNRGFSTSLALIIVGLDLFISRIPNANYNTLQL